jgi:hypothetical protein
MVTVTIERFVEDFSNELAERNVAIFAGAGLSVSAGFVDWKGLLKPLADELSLDVEKEHDLVKVAQYHVNHHGDNRNDLSNAILNGFSRKQVQITDSHKILARLPVVTYWTTNYDTTIEDSLRAGGKSPDVKYEVDHLLQTLHGRDAIVYKMHGDVSNPVTAVLCKEDYETYHIKRGDFLTALAGDLLSKMFLFIGFSFSDPNLDYVLSRLHTRHGKNLRKHYCFVRKESAQVDDKAGDLEYRTAKQELFIRDLQRYNIRAVMVDNYGQIPEVLRMVERRNKSKTIFISGAANNYGALTNDVALDFVHKLSMALVEKKFRIVTGLGLGIGSTVVDGALQQVYRNEKRMLGDELVIRPFPQSVVGKQLWPEYRSNMLDFAGLAIFMFGNKLEGNPAVVVESNGVIEEFEISHAKGVKVLPLGFTEFAARTLWERVNSDFDNFYPSASTNFREIFSKLGDASRSLDDQLTTIIEALTELQKI